MAPRSDTRARRRRSTDVVSIELEADVSRVDLRTLATLRRGGRSVVPLIDLWVASLLPWDVFDLSFEIVGTGPDGEPFRSAPVGGLLLASAFVTLSSHEVVWDVSDEITPPGVRIESLVASVDEAPRPLVVRSSAMPTGVATLANLSRVLAPTPEDYPPVEWRSAAFETLETNAVDAVMLAFGFF